MKETNVSYLKISIVAIVLLIIYISALMSF